MYTMITLKKAFFKGSVLPISNIFLQPAKNPIWWRPQRWFTVDRKRKVLELELHVARQEGIRVPTIEFINENYWEHIETLTTKTARKKYFSFLWQIERRRENKLTKKLHRMQLPREPENISNSLYHNSMFLRIYDTAINMWNNNRLIRALQFGDKLIFDCSYDKNMTTREAANAAKQIMLCFAINRNHQNPFDLHLCNVDFESSTYKYLKRHIPVLDEKWFPMNIHKECFTELFPTTKLVYMTPHCKQDLEEYNHDDIYIIGCIVDKVNNEPLSLSKAKRLNLRMARLPLDKHFLWGSGSGKSLTLDQVTSILLDIQDGKDWNFALRHVPQRKIAIKNESS